MLYPGATRPRWASLWLRWRWPSGVPPCSSSPSVAARQVRRAWRARRSRRARRQVQAKRGGAPLLSLSLREAGYGAHNVAQAGATDTLLLLASLSGMRPAAYVLLASFVISAASLYLALSWRLYVEAGMGGAAPPHEWWWWRCVVAAAGLAGTALHENSMRTMFALHLRLEAGSEGRRTPPRAPRPTSHQISQTSDRTSDISQISGEISHELGASRRSPRSRSASGGALRSASRSSRQSRDSDGDVSEVSDISHEISHVLGEMSDVLGEMSDLEHRDVRRFGASRLLTTPGSSRRLFAPIRNASPLFDADGTTSPSLGQALRGASSEFLARVRLPLPTPHAPTPRMRTPTYTPRMRARTQTPRTHAPRTPLHTCPPHRAARVHRRDGVDKKRPRPSLTPATAPL